VSLDARLLENGTDLRLTESGNIRVLESSTGDQVDLPALALLTENAPTVRNDQTISLPALALLTENGPDVEGANDQTINLPALALLTENAPVARNDQTISLPALALLTENAPVVRNTQTVTLAALNLLTENAPSVAFKQTVRLPVLFAAKVKLNGPRITQTEAGGAPVTYDEITVRHFTRSSTTTGVALDEAWDTDWEDLLTETGAGSVNLQNDDSDLAGIADGDLLRSYVDGTEAFQWLVERRRRHSVAQGEEHDQFTTLAGRGAIAVTEEAVCYPSRGTESTPVEVVRVFGFASLPDSELAGWPTATKMFTQGLPSTYYTGHPIGFPDAQAEGIWDASGSQADAPVGFCHFADPGTFTLAAPSPVSIFWTCDDAGDLYVNGVWVDRIEPPFRTEGWRECRRVTIDLPAGTFTVRARCRNYQPTVVGANPGMFLASIWTTDGHGILDTLIGHTDQTWRCLGYPAAPPGYTIGRVLKTLVDEAQARGELAGVTLAFDENIDSAGSPWPVLAEIGVEVGRDLWSTIRSLLDVYVDVWMPPGALALHAYDHDTRGTTPGITLSQTTNPATSSVVSLDHDKDANNVTCALVQWSGGWLEVDSGASPRKTATFKYGEEVRTIDEARTRATADLAALAARTQVTLEQEPVTGKKPYVNYRVGDTVTVPNESGGTTAERVVGLKVSQNDDGTANYTPLLRDLRLGVTERMLRTQKRMANGSVGGLVAGASPVLPPDVQAVTVRPERVPFTINDSSEVLPPARAPITGTAIRLFVDRDDTTDGGTVTALHNGNPIAGLTVTLSTGEAQDEAVTTSPQSCLYFTDSLSFESTVDGVSGHLEVI
jgi:hypothetical protein